ncbi:hypothetical protein SAY87_019429 [Trapa incisa]|uniref:GH3 middle domain-containing protein n=1 Tax=Trapa incisa TaxID=236973 RepID=A0AAN7JZ78_9MYRT|nr:hypothetical protein SAY87_019429 [Trapa incisa]
MAQYIPTLDFYSGGIPLVSIPYASSESCLGINLQPLSKPSDVSYTLLPNMAYFEFLPLENSRGETETVDLVDVRPGHYYELIVTTLTVCQSVSQLKSLRLLEEVYGLCNFLELIFNNGNGMLFC